jgi:hypothetical protein
LAHDGSFYAFEEVICGYFKRRKLLDDPTLNVSFFPKTQKPVAPNLFS